MHARIKRVIKCTHDARGVQAMAIVAIVSRILVRLSGNRDEDPLKQDLWKPKLRIFLSARAF